MDGKRRTMKRRRSTLALWARWKRGEWTESGVATGSNRLRMQRWMELARAWDRVDAMPFVCMRRDATHWRSGAGIGQPPRQLPLFNHNRISHPCSSQNPATPPSCLFSVESLE